MHRIILPSLAALALTACGGGEPAETASAPVAPAAEETHTLAESTPSGMQSSEDVQSGDTEAAVTEAVETVEAAAEAVVEEVEDHSATLAALGETFVSADLSNGARQYRRCQACHTLNEGGRHTVGPNLYGFLNQPAAQKEGFSYSRQLSEAGLVWDITTLDAWIENPRALVPGNRMSFVGLRDADDRRDVIAYMAIETSR